MADRVEEFINSATVVELKEKLAVLELPTTGLKTELKLRLEEAVKSLSSTELDEIFSIELLHGNNSGSSSRNNGDVNDADNIGEADGNVEQLDKEIESLRQMVQKKREIARLKKELSDLNSVDNNYNNMPNRSFFNFRDVEESLPNFTGDDNFTIQRWISYVEESAEIYGWDSQTIFTFAKRLLNGTAKLFLRTVFVKTWPELKNVLIEEFNKNVTRADIHIQLQNRKKRNEETLQQYVLAMLEIASLSEIAEADVIQYIVNGIPDSAVNKMLLFGASNITELKTALRRYEIMKNSSLGFQSHFSKQRSVKSSEKIPLSFERKLKCFNCHEPGHVSTRCPKLKRNTPSCFACKKPGHLATECPEKICFACRKPGHRAHGCPEKTGIMVVKDNENVQSPIDSEGASQILHQEIQHNNNAPNNVHEFEHFVDYYFYNDYSDSSRKLLTLFDSGSPISFIQQSFLPTSLVHDIKGNRFGYSGINNSPLQINGIANSIVNFNNNSLDLCIFVVKNNCMKYPVILGRDFMKICNLELVENLKKNDDICQENVSTCKHVQQFHEVSEGNENDYNFFNEILSIDISENDSNKSCLPVLNINNEMPYDVQVKIREVCVEAKHKYKVIENLNNKVELNIKLSKEIPFSCTPRRLPYSQKLELQKIIDDLLNREIIQESSSCYASPIVLVRKKNGENRLCVDYRELNKLTLRDNYPLPLIDDLLDRLREKCYFTILDLRSGFHHVKVASDSVKFTSFVTPIGQFEYLKMPFGLKNAPSVFQRFINLVFKKLIESDKLLIYMDDLLIATKTINEHIEILDEVLKIVVENSLELRFDKCQFLYEEIVYLGYIINAKGIRPSTENLKAISEFPIPNSTKKVHSFVGLCSYFRRFILNFATLAKPLYDLLRKDVEFKFGNEELYTFELLKSKLIESPILAIYSPLSETEVHCDASSVGFGAILFQRQNDGKMHPVFYFSKRTTEVESRYHSFELETLAIIYTLRRFRIYLIGIKFKIVTDCRSLSLTLMQDYDYQIEHRAGNRMNHVDALSRVTNILIVEDDTFEFAPAAAQHRDLDIKKIASDLEQEESKFYTLINGLVYRKINGSVAFYVPKQMENEVVRTHHESMCHIGINKCYEYLKASYWFPKMRQKIDACISNCLKCIYFSPTSGKSEGYLHNIPKGNLPFETLHIDHLGPLPSTKNKKQHILVVIDGFTKFVKLYAVNTTKSKEAIKCLESYFETYSRPSKIISDRGTCFTSQEFLAFLADNNVKHIKVATMSPQSNGQVERVNRSIIPMLSKECESQSAIGWSACLPKIEHALNNTINRSTGYTPSMLLFEVNQKGQFCDKIMEFLSENVNNSERNLIDIRNEASDQIKKSQDYNKKYFDKKHKAPYQYQKGDYVMVKHISTTPGINKKLLAKYRGPYEIVEVLNNDRYQIKDIDGLQLSRVPYKGICSPANMKLYLSNVE